MSTFFLNIKRQLLHISLNERGYSDWFQFILGVYCSTRHQNQCSEYVCCHTYHEMTWIDSTEYKCLYLPDSIHFLHSFFFLYIFTMNSTRFWCSRDWIYICYDWIPPVQIQSDEKKEIKLNSLRWREKKDERLFITISRDVNILGVTVSEYKKWSVNAAFWSMCLKAIGRVLDVVYIVRETASGGEGRRQRQWRQRKELICIFSSSMFYRRRHGLTSNFMWKCNHLYTLEYSLYLVRSHTLRSLSLSLCWFAEHCIDA